MKHIFIDIEREIALDEDFVLATIVRHAGSSPRSTGTRMIVHKNGSIRGTIGGGLLEAQVCQEAGEAFRTQSSYLRSYQFDAKKAGDMGMICGGQVEVLFQWIASPDEHLQAIYQALGQALENRRPAWLVTRLIPTHTAVKGSVLPLKCAILSDGTIIGRTDADPEALYPVVRGVTGKNPCWLPVDEKEILIEPVQAQGAVIVFGAGHVSQMLAPLASWVGFNTIILDDRPEFANRERFPSADQVLAPASISEAVKTMEIGPESYLVIVTRGHKDDMSVLAEALRTDAGYIGMIGSQRKRELIYQALLADGFSSADLQRVRSPIGLAIGAETPEEIAISILAELIRVRAGLV